MCHFGGESTVDTAHVAMGYSPSPQEPSDAQAWTYPIDTVLIRRLASIQTQALVFKD